MPGAVCAREMRLYTGLLYTQTDRQTDVASCYWALQLIPGTCCCCCCCCVTAHRFVAGFSSVLPRSTTATDRPRTKLLPLPVGLSPRDYSFT